MYKKYVKVVLLLVLLLVPFQTRAISKEYQDNIYQIVDKENNTEKISIYFFYGESCGHCKKEKEFLKLLEKKYEKDIIIYSFETYNNSSNYNNMLNAKEKMNVNKTSAVPFLVIGDKYYLGYSESVGEKIENTLLKYLEKEGSTINNIEKIPIIGDVNVKEVSVIFLAIILGFIDGFNPCAMWVLLFLINMLIGIKDKKKMLFLGFSFLIISALTYFLSLLGISTFLNYISAPFIRNLIGIFAILFGIYNLYKYLNTRKEDVGCDVIDEKKRKKFFTRIKKFTTEKNVFLALAGVAVLAVSVNVVELACSTVFPAMFLEIMTVNEIMGVERIFYLLIYVIFYMLDDLVIFLIAVLTFKMSAISNKYNKYFKLISGIIMLVVGILLIFKPDWIMLNF